VRGARVGRAELRAAGLGMLVVAGASLLLLAQTARLHRGPYAS
jgi:hypothetical protein